MSASQPASAVFQSLAAARCAAGRGEVVAQLAPLARWIVVSAEDFRAYGRSCGWVLAR